MYNYSVRVKATNKAHLTRLDEYLCRISALKDDTTAVSPTSTVAYVDHDNSQSHLVGVFMRAYQQVITQFASASSV
jgi:hypothetical protein